MTYTLNFSDNALHQYVVARLYLVVVVSLLQLKAFASVDSLHHIQDLDLRLARQV